MLLMTWARFRSVADGLEIAIALNNGSGLSHDQIISIQKKNGEPETKRHAPTFQ